MQLNARNNVMLAMAQSGHSLKEIGDGAGVSRERVRQILKKMGVTTKDFQPEKAPKPIKIESADKAAKDEADKYARPFGAKVPPSRAFGDHKSGARNRGLDFSLTFQEWWALWKEKYHLKGSKKGQYVMCRTYDEGGYTPGNVRIDYAAANGHDKKVARFRKYQGRNYAGGIKLSLDHLERLGL